VQLEEMEKKMSFDSKVLLELQPQEPPLNDPCSNKFFAGKPFVATQGAILQFGYITILACLRLLQREAMKHNGIDYLQIFKDDYGHRLWFIEDEGDTITALLPEEY